MINMPDMSNYSPHAGDMLITAGWFVILVKVKDENHWWCISIDRQYNIHSADSVPVRALRYATFVSGADDEQRY